MVHAAEAGDDAGQGDGGEVWGWYCYRLWCCCCAMDEVRQVKTVYPPGHGNIPANLVAVCAGYRIRSV